MQFSAVLHIQVNHDEEQGEAGGDGGSYGNHIQHVHVMKFVLRQYSQRAAINPNVPP